MKFVERIWGNDANFEAEQEILNYGLDMAKTMVLGLIGALFISVMMHELFKGLLFLIILMPLRQNAGGYHAKTRIRCSIISSLIYIGALVVIKYAYIGKWCMLLVFLVAAMVIIKFAPVDNSNNKLDKVELEVYRDRTRIVLAIESIFFMLLFMSNLFQYAIIIVTSYLVVAGILGLGLIKNRYRG